MRSNPIALAISNYVKVAESMSDPRGSVSTMINDCIICDTRERMRAEGRKAWGVSTAGQPLCADCNYDRMMEMMD